MSADKERLQIVQWVLERNLAWIAAAEVKVGFIVAIDTAMLGCLGAVFSAANPVTRSTWAWLFSIAAAIALGGGLFCASMAVLPRVKGPAKSLLFFGRIGPCERDDYINSLAKATNAELLADWAAQIHRNAQIACDKFVWVGRSMLWSFLAVLPWFLAIVVLLKK